MTTTIPEDARMIVAEHIRKDRLDAGKSRIPEFDDLRVEWYSGESDNWRAIVSVNLTDERYEVHSHYVPRVLIHEYKLLATTELAATPKNV